MVQCSPSQAQPTTSSHPHAILSLPFAFAPRGSMNQEELNRTMEFIVASQARLAAAQEQDRLDLVQSQQWDNSNATRLERLTTRVIHLQDQQSQLLIYQSERMDRLDKFYEDWLRKNDDFQRQALRLLNMILDRLPPTSG